MNIKHNHMVLVVHTIIVFWSMMVGYLRFRP